jgi:hypothetical protein
MYTGQCKQKRKIPISETKNIYKYSTQCKTTQAHIKSPAHKHDTKTQDNLTDNSCCDSSCDCWASTYWRMNIRSVHSGKVSCPSDSRDDIPSGVSDPSRTYTDDEDSAADDPEECGTICDPKTDPTKHKHNQRTFGK